MICPFCKKEAVWCENKEIYGKNYGKSYMCWYCKPCGAYVGCHQNSKRPLGTMANKYLREWRMIAHEFVDSLWKGGKMPRGRVYSEMSNYFGKPVHIGESDLDGCAAIIKWAKERKESARLP